MVKSLSLGGDYNSIYSVGCMLFFVMSNANMAPLAWFSISKDVCCSRSP